jgi:hypothetical protein
LISPEKNGDELFVLRVNDIHEPIGTEITNQIKVIIPRTVDLHNFDVYRAFLVLEGTGFIIQRPVVPFFFLNNSSGIIRLELAPCTTMCF